MRPTRANSDFSEIPLQQLQLPSRNAAGRAASPSLGSPIVTGSGRARGLSPRPFPPNPGQQQASFPFPDRPPQAPQRDLDERFEDALSSSAANSSSSSTVPTMSGIMEAPAEGASIEEIRLYAQAMREQALAFSSSLASTTRLLEASLSSQAPKTNTRKPDLPPFDQKNIVSWIRRVENAFTRVNIASPKDKFAHLEAVMSVDMHPTVNEYFNGAATAENYNSFLDFLRERYGRTKEQKVQSAINGVRRNGRTPMDLAALIDDQIGDVTIEDVKKAHFLAEMPRDVRHNLATQIDSSSFKELAKAAQVYFNRDGTLRAAEPRVNSINPTPLQTGNNTAPVPPSLSAPSSSSSFTTAFEENDAATLNDINAINRQPRNVNGTGNRNSYNGNNTGMGRSQSRLRSNSLKGRGNGNRSASRPRGASNNNGLCWLHNKFGEEARNCKAPCSHPRANAMQQQQQSGNARGGRH